MVDPASRASGAVPVLPDRDQLGEGPAWDDRTSELTRVDILHGEVHGWRPDTGAAWSFVLESEVSAAIPRERGGFVLAAEHELLLRDPDGTQCRLASVEEHLDGNRFNDCRCDPRGRLWAGTMSRTREPGVAALYRLEPGGEIERVIDGTTISNGLGWSPDGERMYFIDSTTQRIDVLDYDLATGQTAGRRPLAEIAAEDGLPDGLAVDAEGGVWVCLFGGGALRRYAPDGTLDAVLELPVTNPTCPTFAGPGLSTLYVTSARHRLTPEQLEREPLAGALLKLDPGVAGLRTGRFAG
jgi:sugar lactone lactonase YvrE